MSIEKLGQYFSKLEPKVLILWKKKFMSRAKDWVKIKMKKMERLTYISEKYQKIIFFHNIKTINILGEFSDKILIK